MVTVGKRPAMAINRETNYCQLQPRGEPEPRTFNANRKAGGDLWRLIPQSQQGFLQDVLRLPRITGHAPRDAVEPPCIKRDHFA